MSHNFIIFLSYINHIFVIITAVYDQILTIIFIFFSAWLYKYYWFFKLLFSTTEWLSELKIYELKTSKVISVLVMVCDSNLCLKGFKNTPSPPGIEPQALNFWSSATLTVHSSRRDILVLQNLSTKSIFYRCIYKSDHLRLKPDQSNQQLQAGLIDDSSLLLSSGSCVQSLMWLCIFHHVRDLNNNEFYYQLLLQTLVKINRFHYQLLL